MQIRGDVIPAVESDFQLFGNSESGFGSSKKLNRNTSSDHPSSRYQEECDVQKLDVQELESEPRAVGGCWRTPGLFGGHAMPQCHS